MTEEPAIRALNAALRRDDSRLWIEADEMEQRDLEAAFLAADKMQRVLGAVLDARQKRWERGLADG